MSTGLMWNLRLARTYAISLFFVGILALATWKRYSTAVGEVWESHLFLGDVGLVVLWASMLNEPHHMRSDKEFSTYNVSSFRNVVKKFRFWSRWDGSVGKAWWPKFEFWNTHCRREATPTSFLWTPHVCVSHVYMCIYQLHILNEIWDYYLTYNMLKKLN